MNNELLKFIISNQMVESMCKQREMINFSRSVTGSEEEIQAAMTSLQQVGFINYYGMQRFGTSSIPTHHIGRLVVLCVILLF